MSPSPNPGELSAKKDDSDLQLLLQGKRGSATCHPHLRTIEYCPRYWILSQLTQNADGPEQFTCLQAAINKGKLAWLCVIGRRHASWGFPSYSEGEEVQETCVQYTTFRVLPKRLVSISPHLKLWQNQHTLHAWQMLRMMESGKAANTHDWSPLGWTGWISLQSKGLSRVFSNTTVQKHQFFRAQLSL